MLGEYSSLITRYPCPRRILPPEVLCRVFEIVHEDCARTESLRWLVISHVCNYWRQCALRHQCLWAIVNSAVMARGLLDVFLKRSGKAPLTIAMSARHPGSTARASYRHILETLPHRVQTLSLCDSATDQWKFWLRLLAEDTVLLLEKPAPMLRALCLKLPSIITKEESIIFKKNTLRQFLSTLAPNIQDVQLEQLPTHCFPWASPPASIRTLVLFGNSKTKKTSILSFSEVLDGLRAMPCLEALRLSKVVPELSEDSSAYTTVKLSNLHALYLEGRGDQYIWLWHLMEPFATRSLRLNVANLHNPDLLRATWTQHMATSDLSALSKMSVEETSTSRLSFAMYPPIHNDVDLDSSFEGPCVEVTIAGEFSTDWNWDSFDVPPQVSEELLSTIPVASLKTLTLHAHHDKYLAHGPFGDLARRAPALETLTLVDYNAFELAALFERLGGNMQGKLDADKELKVILIVLAPRLRKLQLTRCDFGVNVAAPALRRALERRAQAADKVEAIIFDDCLSGSARVEELKAELVREDLVRSFFNIGIEAGEEGSRMDG